MITNSSDLKSYHRPDIQGLRGVAVLLVVIYHTGIAFPGGFIGVDIFFVISGFVITQVLMREFEETGTIRLRNFYARRARRLIPALSLIIVFTLLVSLVAMSPFGEQQQIIKTAVASVFFAGNIHLFAMNSYDALADNPLRHLWSLGVEEQFYWIYPILFLTILRIAKKRFIKVLLVVLAVFAIVSFGIGVLLTYGFEFGYTDGSAMSTQFVVLKKIGFLPGSDWPTKFAFFGAPARFWEILFGSLTALFANRFAHKSRAIAVPLLLVGVMLIIWSSLALGSSSSFPGHLALMPTLGTVLLILFNQQIKPINRFLTSSRLVYIGNISYSLYLWHWPFIVFSRAIWPGNSFTPLVAAAVGFIPAILSYELIEVNFRTRARCEKTKVTSTAIVVVLFFAPLAATAVALQIANTGLGIVGIESKSDHFVSQLGNDCGNYQREFETKCKAGPVKSKFIVYLLGDSHAQAASTGVAEAVSVLGGTLVIATGGGCPFLLINTSKQCDSFNEDRFGTTKLLRPDLVIIVNHQTGYMVDRLNGGGTSWATKSKLIDGLSKTLEWLENLGIPAVVQGEIPVCDFKVNLISKFSKKRQSCWKNYDDQPLHLEFLLASQKLVLNYKRDLFFDPRLTVCPNANCAPFLNNKMIFGDISHLSPTGSRMLTPIYIDAIKKVLE